MSPAAARKQESAIEQESAEHRTIEVIKGVTMMSPRPAPVHASATGGLIAALWPTFDDHYRSKRSGRPPRGPGGWRILPEPELHLRGDILVPDLAGWRTERLPALPKSAYISVAPDWVCEVLSPGTQSIDRHIKMPAYAAAGIRTVWLVAALTRTLEVFRLSKAGFELVATHAGDLRVRAEPFEDLRLELATLWP